ncbi:heat shock protein GrpE [groundwater metagenome]
MINTHGCEIKLCILISRENYIQLAVITISPVVMEQENLDDIRKNADKFESRYNELKQEFKDYIEVSRKNEEKKRIEIKADLSKKLLVVADSLTRISGSDNEQTCEMMKNYSDNIRKNIEAIYDRMLYASGLTPIEPGAGDKFDEQRHVAVGLEFGTKYPQNSIFRIVRKGYLFENNIVRPAEVIVSKNPVEQKKIKSGFWDRLTGLIKIQKPQISEINKRIDEIERVQKEKLDTIVIDLESMRNSFRELETKAKQTCEMEVERKQKIAEISKELEFLKNSIRDINMKTEEKIVMQKEKFDKIPWV